MRNENFTFRQTLSRSIITLLNLILAGCLGGGLGTSSHTVTPVIAAPVVNLEAPSSTAIRSAGTVTILATITTSGTLDLTSIDLAGAGVTLSGATAGCLVTVTRANPAVISITGCSGSGSLTVTAAAAFVIDTAASTSAVSNAKTITVDNVVPAYVSVTPTDASSISDGTRAVQVTLSENIESLADNTSGVFAIGGTCVGVPTISSVSTSGAVLTANLSTNTCGTGDTVSITIDTTKIHDLAGNAGVGSTAIIYTVDATAPTVALGVPSLTHLKSSATSTLTATFTPTAPAAISTSTILTNGSKVTLTGTTAGCTAAPTQASPSVISITGCTGNGVLTVATAAGFATDNVGNASIVSGTQNITIDNVAPTFSSSLPATAAQIGAATLDVAVTFSEVVTAISDNSTNVFAISGTCAGGARPTITGVSTVGAVVTASLSTNTCADASTVIVTVDRSKVTDLAGNAGAGSQVLTYAVAVNGPTVALAAPNVTNINSAGTATISATLTPETGSTLDLTTIDVLGTDVSLTGATAGCAASVTQANPAVISITGCSGNGVLTVSTLTDFVEDSVGNHSSVSGSRTITIDNVAPTVTSTAPVDASTIGETLTSVAVTFDAAVTAINDNSANVFSISGTCGAPPTVTGVGTVGAVVTASLSAYTCADAETLVVTVDLTKVTDLAGNAGAGTSVTNYSADAGYLITTQPGGDLSGAGTFSLGAGVADSTINVTFDRTMEDVSLNAATMSCAGGTTDGAVALSLPATADSLTYTWTPDTTSTNFSAGATCTILLAGAVDGNGNPEGATFSIDTFDVVP